MDNECLFKWKFNCDNSNLREVRPARIETIIKYSKEYEDSAHTELEAKLKDDSNLKLKCYRNCVSSYTSAEHLNVTRSAVVWVLKQLLYPRKGVVQVI